MPSMSAVVRFRCSPQQAAAYQSLARLRGKSLAALIRDGLDAICVRVCLCQPGKPICAMCSAQAASQLAGKPQAASGQPGEPVRRLHRDAYCHADAPDGPPQASQPASGKPESLPI